MNLWITSLVVTLFSWIAVAILGQGQQISNNWAVLVAGSNGYSNYRHQADVSF